MAQRDGQQEKFLAVLRREGQGERVPRSPAERIELPGLVLQRQTVADAERVARAVADNLSHLGPWMAWAVPEAAARSVQRERLASSMERWHDGTEYVYLLLARDSDGLLGMCGLHRRVGPGGIELGYWLIKAAVGHGHVALGPYRAGRHRGARRGRAEHDLDLPLTSDRAAA